MSKDFSGATRKRPLTDLDPIRDRCGVMLAKGDPVVFVYRQCGDALGSLEFGTVERFTRCYVVIRPDSPKELGMVSQPWTFKGGHQCLKLGVDEGRP